MSPAREESLQRLTVKLNADVQSLTEDLAAARARARIAESRADLAEAEIQKLRGDLRRANTKIEDMTEQHETELRRVEADNVRIRNACDARIARAEASAAADAVKVKKQIARAVAILGAVSE